MRISTLFEAVYPAAPSASTPLIASDRRPETAGNGASPQGHPSLLHLKKEEEVPILCSCPVSGPEIVSTANPNPGPTPHCKVAIGGTGGERGTSFWRPQVVFTPSSEQFPSTPDLATGDRQTSPTFSCRPRPRPPFSSSSPANPSSSSPSTRPLSLPYSSLLIPTGAPTATRRCSVAETTTTARRTPKYSHPLQLAARTLSFFSASGHPNRIPQHPVFLVPRHSSSRN